MDTSVKIRNRSVARVTVERSEEGAIRAALETADGDSVVLQDGTLSALVRAWIEVSTHPLRPRVELTAQAVPAADGDASWHLIEAPVATPEPDGDAVLELDDPVDEGATAT